MRLEYASKFRKDTEGRPGFSRRTRILLTAMRVIAYSFATLFMILMILRGVWLTQQQMENEASRSVATAVTALEGLARSGPINPAQAGPMLNKLAPTGVQLRLEQFRAGLPLNHVGSQVAKLHAFAF